VTDRAPDQGALVAHRLMLPVLGLAEQAPDHPVVHVDGVIGERSHQIERDRHKQPAAVHRRQLGEVLGGHPAALATELPEPPLRDPPRPLGRQPDRPEMGEPGRDQLEAPGARGAGGPPQPSQKGAVGLRGQVAQRVETAGLVTGQAIGQTPQGAALGFDQNVGAEPLDHADAGNDDLPSAHLLNHGRSQHPTLHHAHGGRG
jgi:hypothetical protein